MGPGQTPQPVPLTIYHKEMTGRGSGVIAQLKHRGAVDTLDVCGPHY